MDLDVPEDALARLRTLFIEVEGSCEMWPDEEVVRRMLIRGAMDYAKSAGWPWNDVRALAAALRQALA